jgi:acyl-CoA dehydrogenase
MGALEEHTDTFPLLRESIRKYVEKEIVPKGAAWEEQGFVPREVLREMGSLGFLGLRYPEEFGGAALDARATALLAEELGRSTFGGFAITVLVHTDMASPHLNNAGTPEQIRRYLPKIISGEAITAVAVTEPDAGSDVKSIRTTARREGGDYVLNGTKMFITNGALADVLFVAAKTDPAAGSKGISIFIVEKGMKGFSVGRKLDKHGWRSSDTAELVFDGCRVPAANLLGREGTGFKMLMQKLQQERLVIAVTSIASCRRALDDTLAYVKERRAFGQPIAAFQNTQFTLAELWTEVEVGQAFVDRLLAAHVRGEDIVMEVSGAKAWTTDLQKRLVGECLQLHGGYGFMLETPIARDYADAAVQSIYAGTNEIMKVIIARRLGLG